MKLPVHRWFRFSAGFSAEWVTDVLKKTRLDDQAVIFDPFAGSGTTLLAGEASGIQSIGIEAHPFVVRVAKAKLSWHEAPHEFRRLANTILIEAKENNGNIQTSYPSLIHKCYPNGALSELDSLKVAWEKLNDGSQASELTWLALTAILRMTSPVGTANMELIQPKKSKSNMVHPFEAFSSQVDLMYKDMLLRQTAVKELNARIFKDDARECNSLGSDSIDLIITSPLYANNFDYADATRLELSFWGEVQGWADLQPKIRKHLIHSCSQHVSVEKLELDNLLNNKLVAPIIDELEIVCDKLGEKRLSHGGKKKYHIMVAAYFVDLAQVWKALRRVCKNDSLVCFVIGDSAPYGIYVPVDKWLGELALDAGFKHYYFEKTRDRNIKWKNRKHRIPLKEGRLWVQG